MDFTLDSYGAILDAALRASIPIHPVIDWHELPKAQRRGIMLRHDVDRRPGNALEMARLEAAKGVRSTYYFRIVRSAFHPDVIRSIAELGHEIGYHYEDWWLGRRDPSRAIESFERNLERVRQLAPVRSIAMHGSPLARESNLTIWKHADFRKYDVVDVSLSFDYSGCVFFTDSGRTFGASGANMRDYLPGARAESSIETSRQLADYLSGSPADRIQIAVHPERWNPPGWRWQRQRAIDAGANTAKRIIRRLRR